MFDSDVKKNLEKVFIIAGECSGDITAAWYIKKIKDFGNSTGPWPVLLPYWCPDVTKTPADRPGVFPEGGTSGQDSDVIKTPADRPEFFPEGCNPRDIIFYGVGGEALEKAGVTLCYNYSSLNVTGVLEVIKYIPKFLFFIKRLIKKIDELKIDRVVLVDFPGFNLRLMKKIKKYYPNIFIIYLAPPQMWCWGSWRIRSIKKYCDEVIVLYPHEVDWYKAYGLTVKYIGNPTYETLEQIILSCRKKESLVALIPGSRDDEIKKFLHICLSVAKRLKDLYPEVNFILPCASSFTKEWVKDKCINLGYKSFLSNITFVQGEERYEKLSQCCLAITKPGTITLELALLSVPSIVMFKISWVTYLLAKLFVKVKFMSLPNLFLDKFIFPEYIQKDCTKDNLFSSLSSLYKSFKSKTQKEQERYKNILDSCEEIKDIFDYKCIVKRY